MISVRELRTEELSELQDHSLPQSIRQWIQSSDPVRDGRILYGAYDNHQLVGFSAAGYSDKSDSAEIRYVHVNDPAAIWELIRSLTDHYVKCQCDWLEIPYDIFDSDTELSGFLKTLNPGRTDSGLIFDLYRLFISLHEEI